MCSVEMVQCGPLLRLSARGECHQCDAPCPRHPQRRLKNGSLRPAKSAPIIYSLAVALRAVIRGSAAIEPTAEALGRRGGTRSLGLQRRIFTPDEGSPHFERHGRFADSSSAFGPCKNREHSEISRSQNKGRPNRGLSGLRHLTLSRPTGCRPIGGRLSVVLVAKNV